MPLPRASVPIPAPAAPRRTVSPLLPVLLPLVLASIAINLLFAWWFPNGESLRPTTTARFTDVTAAAGIHFVHRHGTNHSPTSLGGAVVVLDYDQDGRPDLFFVNGSPWPWSDNAWQSPGTSALYHNNGDSTFTDVTLAAGLDFIVNGMSAVSGDYDADGYPDLYVTAIGRNHLWHNRGDGTFSETTDTAGVGGDDNTWSTGAVWLDYNHDSRLDLIVAHYARWPTEVGLAAAFSVAQVGRSYGTPVGFIGADPTVYQNLGDGRFTVVRNVAGLRHPDPNTGLPTAKTLAIGTLDANNDGLIDLRFTYHTSPDAYFLAQPDGTFLPWTPTNEVRREGLSGAMATSGALPLATIDDLTQVEQTPLPPSRVPADFTDLTAKLAALWFDYDNDGHTDFFSASAVAEHDTNLFPDEPTSIAFARPPALWHLTSNGWQPTETDQSPSWTTPLVARGLATLDYDGDGDLDLVIARNDGPAMLLRNDQRTSRPWLDLRLIATRSHPDAVGARVELHTPRRVFVRTLTPPTGFMSQSSARLHFGLGEDSRVRRIVIRWPSGQRQELRPTDLNTLLTVREP